MNVFFISNGIWEYDGRLRELIKVASNLGKIKYITRINNTKTETDSSHIKVESGSYFYFILKSIFEGLKYKNIEILFVDNRKAIIPALIVMLFKRPNKIILDVRELYLYNEVKHISGKIGCILEKILIKKADVVISANKYRADIMKNYYNLRTLPLVYENIRKFEYSNNVDFKILSSKYDYIFKNNNFKLISTSGYSVDRTNDRLVEAMAKLGSDYELLLVGGGSLADKNKIQSIIDKYKLSNVYLIEKVEEDELKYLISNSQLGVVNYHQNDLNNRFCASGKIYEFLYEGLPVITTENRPLVDLITEHKLGVADNEYFQGVFTVRKEYNYYKNRVSDFLSNLTVESNNNYLKDMIIELLKAN